jgi:hypothetical protein
MPKDEPKTIGEGWLEQLADRMKGLSRVMKDFLRGMAYHEVEADLSRQRAKLENLLMMYTFGDLLGLPIFRGYYALRLFPYFLPRLESWKKRTLRERDLTDLGGVDL